MTNDQRLAKLYVVKGLPFPLISPESELGYWAKRLVRMGSLGENNVHLGSFGLRDLHLMIVEAEIKKAGGQDEL